MAAFVNFDVEIRNAERYKDFMRQVKPALDAAERPEPRADRRGKVTRRGVVLRQRRPQDVARFLFHGALPVRRPHAQAGFGVRVEFADRDAGHAGLRSKQ